MIQIESENKVFDFLSRPTNDGRHECLLCPHRCKLRKGQEGICRVRTGGEKSIEFNAYGAITTMAVEPIEKKPLFHFMPGMKTLSVGGHCCTMDCDFCVPGCTMISTADGLKRIDQVVDGEKIYVFDPCREDLQPVLAHVGHVFYREAEELIELEVDGKKLTLTPEHPVLTKKRGWVEAQDLTLDDEVLCDKND